MFTRRHYETIARDLHTTTGFAIYQHNPDVKSFHALLCNDLAVNFAAGNAQFDRVRFLRACGLSDETIDAL